jgi:hypothetical protein
MALIRTDVSEDRIASIFMVYECEQAQSEVVSSCIGNDSYETALNFDNADNGCSSKDRIRFLCFLDDQHVVFHFRYFSVYKHI